MKTANTIYGQANYTHKYNLLADPQNCYTAHNEAEKKWPPFGRRHFQMQFVEWKFVHFDSNFTEGSNWQKVSIGSD